MIEKERKFVFTLGDTVILLLSKGRGGQKGGERLSEEHIMNRGHGKTNKYRSHVII